LDDIAVARRVPDVANRSTARSSRFFRAGRWPEGSFARDSSSKQAGFALVAVIWTLGLITLLGMAVMVGARYRTRVASNYAAVVATGAAAESAINLGIATALTKPDQQNAKFPLRCRMPGGERVIVTVEEETGKVDLNMATPAVLALFFTALTRDQSLATRIAARIVEFRTPKGGEAKGPAARPANEAAEPRFTTIMQLDQIDGVSPQLFRAALRFVTVRSGRTDPDVEAASPVLRTMLNLQQKQAAPARALPAGGSVTIRADVSAPDGTRFIREALVTLGTGSGKPFVVREWRRGDIDSGTVTSAELRDGEQETSCFREAIAS
jgi:general secretion pathway protein K